MYTVKSNIRSPSDQYKSETLMRAMFHLKTRLSTVLPIPRPETAESHSHPLF